MKKLTLTSLVAFAAVFAGAAVAATVTVSKGDTMKKIADANGMTFQSLRDLNPQVKNPNLIFPGQKLNISGDTSSQTTAAQTVRPVKVVAVQPVADDTASKPCASDTCDNVLNGNPLYRPAQGNFYSITTLGTSVGKNDSLNGWGLNEQFGFGITDQLSAFLTTDFSTYKFKSDSSNWNNLGVGLSFRYLDMGNWKADAYGSLTAMNLPASNVQWWDSDTNVYNWNVGTRFGYSTCDWTVAGLFEYDYMNTGAFNWNDTGLGRDYRLGLEGQYAFNSDWNIVAGVTYEMPEFADNYWTGKIGVNYNFTSNMYLGLYATQELADNNGWKLDDNTGLALQFGIDF